METCKIYTLLDPRTGAIRYVGRTVQLLQNRLQQHIWKSEKEQHARAKWIQELARENLRPEIHLVAEVPVEYAVAHEKQWTRDLLNQGVDLLNDGIGRGGCNHPKRKIEWTPELDALLGKIADSRIAEMLGVTRKSVVYRRQKLNREASFDRSRNVPPPDMAGHNRIELPEDVIALLGQMPDHELATQAGVSKKRIMVERQARSIPSFAKRTGKTGQFRKGNYPGRWKKQLR